MVLHKAKDPDLSDKHHKRKRSSSASTMSAKSLKTSRPSTALTNQKLWRSDYSIHSGISDLEPLPLSSNTPDLGPVLLDCTLPLKDFKQANSWSKYSYERQKYNRLNDCRASEKLQATMGSRPDKSSDLTLSRSDTCCSQSSGLYFCESDREASYERNKLPEVLPIALTQGVSSSKVSHTTSNKNNYKFMMDTFRSEGHHKQSSPSPRDDRKWYKHLDEDIIDDRTYEIFARKSDPANPVKADSRYPTYNNVRKKNSTTPRNGDYALSRTSRSQCFPVFGTSLDGWSAPVRKVGVVQARHHKRVPPDKK